MSGITRAPFVIFASATALIVLGFAVLGGAAAGRAVIGSGPSGGGGAGMMGGGTSGGSGGGTGMMGGGPSGGGGAGMMGGGTSGMGKMMGSAMADAPGPRLPESSARTLGDASPTGATVHAAQRIISFQTKDVNLWVLASPDWGTDMTFRIAGLTDPTLIVPQGARVTVHFVNADVDTSHGWLLTSAAPPFSFMAMMSAPPAVSGAFAPPLGDATSAGMPVETVSFIAATAGRYTYLCPVPGHAQRGMYGAFLVQ